MQFSLLISKDGTMKFIFVKMNYLSCYIYQNMNYVYENKTYCCMTGENPVS